MIEEPMIKAFLKWTVASTAIVAVGGYVYDKFMTRFNK